jgi:hypothetical protein
MNGAPCSVHRMEFAVGFHFTEVTSLIHDNVNQQLDLEVLDALNLGVIITLLESNAKAVPDDFSGQPLRRQRNIDKGSLTSTPVAAQTQMEWSNNEDVQSLCRIIICISSPGVDSYPAGPAPMMRTSTWESGAAGGIVNDEHTTIIPSLRLVVLVVDPNRVQPLCFEDLHSPQYIGWL